MNIEKPITKIIPLTMQNSIDRQWAFKAGMKAQGVPEDDIFFFAGHAGKDYKDNMLRVARAAADDGFAWIYAYAREAKTEYCEQTAASVSQVWNVARFLRWLVNQEETETVLFSWDDKVLNLPYGILSYIVLELQAEGNFYLLQLQIRDEFENIPYEPPARKEAFFIDKIYYEAIIHNTIDSYKNLFLKDGMLGYDESFVITPTGAYWMLQQLSEIDDFYIFFDHCLAEAFPKLAEKAITDYNAGIYCPKSPGFNFIHEPFKFGTGTDWAHEESEHYQSSREKSEIQFIEDIT